MKPIHAGMSIIPRTSPSRAMTALYAAPHDGQWPIDLSQCQITPQNFCQWTPALTRQLMMHWPATAFRFHASVRLAYTPLSTVFSWFDVARTVIMPKESLAYWQALKACNNVLGNPTYTLHAGMRPRGARGDLRHLLGGLERIREALGCHVAVESHYPTAKGSVWWLDSWREMEWLLQADIPFVLDLSHLNIIVETEGRQDDLVKSLLASPQLTEIHISGNDGSADQHTSLTTCNDAWWLPLVENYTGSADIFSEGVIANH